MEVQQSAYPLKRLFYNSFPLILIGLWMVAYWPTFLALYQRWVQWDESLAHGLPVMLVFVYLVHTRLSAESGPVVGPAERVMALVALAGLSLCWSIFYLINIDILAQLILLPILVAGFWAVYGFRVVVRHRLMWLFFLFAVPVWDYLNDPLLFLSSEVVGSMVRVVQMPAVIQGNSIFIPHGHILIADGCSGLRYLVIALALGYLISLLNHYRESQLAAVLAVAALLGLITNWIRIFALIVIGYQTEMQSPLMQDHEYYGWALFALVCLPAIYFAPVVKSRIDNNTGRETVRPQPSGALAGLVAALILGPLVSLVSASTDSGQPLEARLQGVGRAVGPEKMPVPVTAPEAGSTETAWLMAEDTYIRVDQYQKTRREQKLVPYISRLYDSGHWQLTRQSETASSRGPVTWSVFREKGGAQTVVQAQWFQVGQYQTNSIVKAKLWQLPAALKGQRRFSIVTLQAVCQRRECTAEIEHQLKPVIETQFATDESRS